MMAEKRSASVDSEGKGTTKNGSASERGRPSKRTKIDLVGWLNGLPNDQFVQEYLHMCLDASSFSITHWRSNELSDARIDECLTLIEQTSADDYKASSIGWDAAAKRKEMADADMHYLLIQDTAAAGTEDGSPLDGFLSFMLTYDSSPSVPVLYVYEIHIVEQYRKQGLGVHLMNLASTIARSTGMSKVMLTCFVSNSHARKFYERLGFKKDVVSPDGRRTRGRVIMPDYLIMGKDVGST